MIKMGLKIDEEDMGQAVAIQKMMQTEGWKVLEAFLQVQREAIISNLKILKKEDTLWERIGRLRMIDWLIEAPYKIIQRTENKDMEELDATH